MGLVAAGRLLLMYHCMWSGSTFHFSDDDTSEAAVLQRRREEAWLKLAEVVLGWHPLQLAAEMLNADCESPLTPGRRPVAHMYMLTPTLYMLQAKTETCLIQHVQALHLIQGCRLVKRLSKYIKLQLML